VISCAFVTLACVSPKPIDVGLARHRDVLRDHFGHRLAQMHPYVWAEDGVVWFLTCRWATGAEVGVGLAGGGPLEARALAAARGAWERESLDVSLVPAKAADAPIRIDIVETVDASDGAPGAGSTTADCALDPGEPPTARLVGARARIAREAPPTEGGGSAPRDPRVLSDEERVGVFVHELGHLLGFQGHAVSGTVMASGREGARVAGGRVARGRALDDSTLSALYALPEGTVLARTEIAPVRTAELDRLGRLATERGWEGPRLRVGDRSARIFWRDADGAEFGFVLVNLEETLRLPDRALFIAEETARAALED